MHHSEHTVLPLSSGTEQHQASGRRIVLAGASGFLGSLLAARLQERGDEVTVISRNAKHSANSLPAVHHHLSWSDEAAVMQAIDGATAVVNLSGANVGEGRWTAARKKEILSSRLDSTRRLVDFYSRVPSAPPCFVSVSAVGYYGAHGDEWIDESAAAGKDFLAQVCLQWETESQKASAYTRVVNPRIGVVLDAQSGALAKMLLPFRLFIGGPLGSGQQWMPWIHRDDLLRALIECIDNPALCGAVNCAAPEPVRMRDFAKCIAKALHRPAFMKVPTIVLRLLLGEQHQIVCMGQRVRPKALTDQGFEFLYSSCQISVNELLFKK